MKVQSDIDERQERRQALCNSKFHALANIRQRSINSNKFVFWASVRVTSFNTKELFIARSAFKES